MSTFTSLRIVEEAARERPMGDPVPARSEPAMSRDPVLRLDGHLVSLLQPESFEAEQYRTLRHMIEIRHKTVGLTVLAVSSPGVGDGKTTTSINLAGSLAQARDARVLLIDADLRRPAVGASFGLQEQSGRGVAAVVLERLPLQRAALRFDRYNLSVLLAGRCAAGTYEVLKSQRFGELLQEARRFYDYVIVDTPPLLAVPDCRQIDKSIDAFLIVVAANGTPRKLLEEALNVLEPTRVIGLVLNRDDRPLSGYYHYYDRYYGSTRKRGSVGGSLTHSSYR